MADYYQMGRGIGLMILGLIIYFVGRFLRRLGEKEREYFRKREKKDLEILRSEIEKQKK